MIGITFGKVWSLTRHPLCVSVSWADRHGCVRSLTIAAVTDSSPIDFWREPCPRMD